MMNTQSTLPIPFFDVADGMGYYIGRNIQTKLHEHHAVEIIVALGKPFSISTEQDIAVEDTFSIIAANFPHSFIGQDDIYLFIFLDPQLSFAKQLEGRLHTSQQSILHGEDADIKATKLMLSNLLPKGSVDIFNLSNLIHQLLSSLCPSVHDEKETDQRIIHAKDIIMSSLHQPISLSKLAAQVYLSPSRFAHLFTEQTRIPFRRYVLWCRIQVALKAVISGQSLTQAAYEGGFSDGSHLSRTFLDMFGVSPSSVLKY